jgi:hypothetical protein
VLLLLAGCGGKARPVAYEDLTPKVGPLEFTHITVDLSRTRAELLKVLRRNNPGRKLRVPPIDYTRQETFLVAVGPRSSTGYALQIVRVEDQGATSKSSSTSRRRRSAIGSAHVSRIPSGCWRWTATSRSV